MYSSPTARKEQGLFLTGFTPSTTPRDTLATKTSLAASSARATAGRAKRERAATNCIFIKNLQGGASIRSVSPRAALTWTACGISVRIIEEICGALEAPVDEVRTLRRLEQLALVEFRSNEALRIRLSLEAPWRTGGPLWLKYRAQAVEEFFDTDFTSAKEHFKVTLGPALPSTADVIRRKIQRLQDEILQLIALDRSAITDVASSDGYWFVTAFRPMNFTAIRRLALERAMANLDPHDKA